MIIISLVMSSYNLSMYCPFVQQTWVFFLKEWCILLFSMAYISSFCLLPLPTLMENSVPRSWAWWFLLVEKIIYIRYKDMLLSCMLCVHYFRTQFSSQAIYTPSWCYARNVENQCLCASMYAKDVRNLCLCASMYVKKCQKNLCL